MSDLGDFYLFLTIFTICVTVVCCSWIKRKYPTPLEKATAKLYPNLTSDEELEEK